MHHPHGLNSRSEALRSTTFRSARHGAGPEKWVHGSSSSFGASHRPPFPQQHCHLASLSVMPRWRCSITRLNADNAHRGRGRSLCRTEVVPVVSCYVFARTHHLDAGVEACMHEMMPCSSPNNLSSCSRRILNFPAAIDLFLLLTRGPFVFH